ncbi:hypothetical protein OF829_06910 [Sphingomonas sp. LB-2]|uniref:hypothetical protein n=1 Tax=Sphingomonas caeni TaxID=2984949 RepID=UPI002230C2A2|nr:hypothetical protein [Sphingomonas caeni]MCW3846964.1 hypothetical protein [Sphingomonas caeni]
MKRRLLAMLALSLPMALGGCGAREALVQPKGKPMPVAAYAAQKPPSAEDLLAAPMQTRPARSDDLIESSEERRSDEFELPPPN